ncbi:glutamate 5-kinase [Alkalilimnicola sp. S0819]|uniref:glutamate 5-kinase n=1 Tax=Alkalilimnicola sp. S0819 TaxID=2613922 RepID=UPI00126285AB|nr:glutamate 5-kinase [Alkalilimnicola sp. S0819]KAB7623142.1 glutamate 5-kinase [Alkalilimnicola sp. S0819]MPQ16986.1 glutamate 5-kinase [Alkalilimnicola sp. S0819]
MSGRSSSERWVVKVGSALVTDDGRGLDRTRIAAWVEQIAELRRRGLSVILVSSGAVAEGMQRLGWRQRPRAVHELQAAAAVGQMGLVQAYEAEFQRYGLHTAQVLLTHEDLSNRRRYLNARSTLKTLLELGVVPVVNENDTVVTDEIRFGDNDTLAALVANLGEADQLVILTDQQGLYDGDPRSNPHAALVREARAGDPSLDAMCSAAAGAVGSGGMLAKVRAGARAARSGTVTRIASGREERVLLRLQEGEALGTRLSPAAEPLAARKRWLAGQLQLRGKLWLDAGAVRVLREQGRSLLAVGVSRVEGRFSRGEVVACLGPDGVEVARGLANYGADEARRIQGRGSDEIESLLGYVGEPELIHRDNLVLTG